MNSCDSKQPDWSGYFDRTETLPDSARIKPFLDMLPQSARLLDFGCGTGRFSAAFLRDRPDLHIDVLDQHLDKAPHIPQYWKGKRYQQRFQDFVPEFPYDGIWANAVLFLLPLNDMKACFSMLAGTLSTQGVLEFSLVANCKTASDARFTGMDIDSITDMLRSNSLETLSFKEYPDAVYGMDKVVISTYHIRAKKIQA